MLTSNQAVVLNVVWILLCFGAYYWGSLRVEFHKNRATELALELMTRNRELSDANAQLANLHHGKLQRLIDSNELMEDMLKEIDALYEKWSEGNLDDWAFCVGYAKIVGGVQ